MMRDRGKLREIWSVPKYFHFCKMAVYLLVLREDFTMITVTLSGLGGPS